METTGEPAADQGARHAYEAISPVYDLFTADHDYETWLTMLLELGARHGLSGTRLLDIACGTGTSFIPLLDRGWAVNACDISPAMVSAAKGKAGTRAEIVVADMREMPFLGGFDLVLCLGDAVNYLMDFSELVSTFEGMRRNMRPGALAIVEMTTLKTYRTVFSGTSVTEVVGVEMTWAGRVGESFGPGDIAEAEFTAGGPDVVVQSSLHRQRHHPPGEVDAAITEAGLELVGEYGLGEGATIFSPPDEERDTKMIYIAQKAEV